MGIAEHGSQAVFLSIPAELRIQIYELVLIEGNIVTETTKSPAQDHPLLLTCRQVRQEALSIYYQRNTFTFEVSSFDVRRLASWISVSKYRRDSTIELVLTGARSWPNLLHWLELYFNDECIGVYHPEEPQQSSHDADKYTASMLFELVDELDRQHLPWTAVMSLLETTRKTLATVDLAWKDDFGTAQQSQRG